MPLKVISINTGAGVVSYPGGVEIAVVREDSTTALCEDSCTFADDGQCDEPGVVRKATHCCCCAAGAAGGSRRVVVHSVSFVYGVVEFSSP